MPYKNVKEKNIDLNFLFFTRGVETVNNKCMRHNVIVLYVSHWPA